ncbi:hypothetical protein O7626_14590 [Micromonospora sp. WMMD1102]|uniref:hypothetical protein n=1 Tax=Micromonospora sp. WMMD1102 TaxID=3016105 RepID=UPI002414F6EB|nr:hypothetical protein [Micromonospora sp. WMMD1102]MDG4787143.1 hypothetical protein [Micromonospora sp. WMMD1102]
MFDPKHVIAEIGRDPQNAGQVIERLELTDGNLRSLSDRLGIPSRSRASRGDLMAGLSAYFDSQQPMDAPVLAERNAASAKQATDRAIACLVEWPLNWGFPGWADPCGVEEGG